MASFIRFFLLAFTIIFFEHTLTFATKKSYIIYLGTHQHGLNPTELDAQIATRSHYDFLESILGSYEKVQESVQYSYNRYINGIAAKLTEDEAEMIKNSPNVISLFENRRLNLQTTRSWEFLGLEKNGLTPNDSLWNITKYGDNIIIGNIDTGVWPESESFNDEGLGPIPSRWKGECMSGSDPKFKCNKKLIGARYFHNGTSELLKMINETTSISPRDMLGHGTHTLSTAGGRFVKRVSAYGFGFGNAKGGSPNARVAAYKACWYGCMSADIIAAFEAAIGDGVDVVSISINSEAEHDYKEDETAIMSFHAFRHGIVVVNSAGNYGPSPSTVSSIAPWILTVGASTFDREFYNEVYLGNSSLSFKGAYIGPNRMLPRKHFHPLIVGTSAMKNSSTAEKARLCEEDSLDSSKVKGKIVVCEYPGNTGIPSGKVVQEAGGVGMIIVNPKIGGSEVYAEPHYLPASHLSYKDGQTILDYINKTINPTAYISDITTVLGIKPAPVMADFSSRGPSVLYPRILKPDIIAPGVNVIAAYSGATGPSDFVSDTRRVKYYVMSGTSMSCPHVSGIVALLKSLHPDWSPAAIHSALMTTATIFDSGNKPILDYDKQQVATPFAYGAGHINPNAAADPGLIYNLTENDYLDFLCSLGSYSEKDFKLFTPNPYKCRNSISSLDLNYPSITVSNFNSSVTLKRTVTNVGKPGTYEVRVIAPSGINVSVIPSKLKFSRIGEEKVFRVEISANGVKPKQPHYVFGSLVWSDGTHNVTSPLVVKRA